MGHLLYVIGGILEDYSLIEDFVHILDTKTMRWKTQLVVGKPPRLAKHSAVLFNRIIVIFGGVEGLRTTRNVYFYDVGE